MALCCKPSTDNTDVIGTETPEGDGKSKALGAQTISSWGSFVLNINNLVGPALVTFPLVYQSAGWLTPTLLLVIMTAFTAFNGSMLCEAMQRIPGNYDFRKRKEFATTIKHYWGRKGYIAGQILVNLCLQAGNIASIIVAAQVMDDFIVYAFKHSYAFRFVPPIGFITSSTDTEHPFGETQWIITLGYCVSMAICIPFGWLNLDQNMWFQWFSFVGMTITLGEFLVQFFLREWHPEYVPVFGNVEGVKSQALVLGTVVFSCAYSITVPSWVNEKQPKVNVNKSIWLATVASTLYKFSFAYLASIAYRNEGHVDNILNVMTAKATGGFGVVTRLSVYLFNMSTIIPGIPVYSILVRYNLITGKLLGPKLAFLVGVVAPWMVSMFFYHGRGLSSVVNWTAVLIQGAVNFVFPAILFYQALKRYPQLIPFKQKVDEEQPTTPDAASQLSINASPINPPEETPTENGTLPNEHGASENTPLLQPAEQLPSNDDTCESLPADYRPVNAVPRWLSWKALSVSIMVVMAALTLATLGLDFFYLVVRHEDIVDN